ncbi:MAG: sugar phosphate nucleotidyltransferase [Candidatus Pacebacteria bacterium]|nr:sugar phosphate nucleotidyltransferase [Candidatus Paceibacterota bacterium]MDD5555405.1 sugar phosphate nucleotidyltransferase [Candidatus Paceibacterota bacterium]
MQAVILAAGKGTRFEPLSLTRPKPLFSVMGESILEHNLKELKGLIDEAIIIYNSELVKEKVKEEFGGIKIRYVFQEEMNGTGAAVKLAYPFLEDKFLVLNGDDFYFQEDIKRALKKFPCLLAKEHEKPSNFGVVLEKEGLVKELAEKPANPASSLVNTGLYFLPKSILETRTEKSERGEYEFTDFIKNFIKQNSLYIVKAGAWFPASYPWDVFDALDYLFQTRKAKNKGKKEKNVVIKGKVIIGPGTLVKSGSYIEGPAYIGKNCVIGPNCHLRPMAIIGDNCKIGQAVEIKNSIIGENTNISHLSYVGDSIIGSDCNLGAGTIIANLRHDNDTVKTMVKGQAIDTKRKKFGTIMGDGVKTGIGTFIYPGRKIWPTKTTLPGEKVDKDII